MARPRGDEQLEKELRAIRNHGIDVLVSALTDEEVEVLGLERELEACAAHGIEFVRFPIEDLGVPASREDMRELAGRLAGRLAEGKRVAIHCRGGVGRASLLAACVLALEGDSADEAFAWIRRARGCNVPNTDEQRRWVEEFERVRR
jgi:protein-tyrosine phosphatase